MAGVLHGSEALSGSHTVGLLVAEGLARRGHEVGLCVVNGQRIIDSSFELVPTLDEGAKWIGTNQVIWISYGDDAIYERLRSAGLRPTIWTHLPVNRSERAWLENGTISGLITVSDTCRIPLLRCRRHALVGRIYNPLAPVFADSGSGASDRYSKRTVVYAGAAGPTKGLHRLLEMWKFVHTVTPAARLLLAGTGRLYGAERELGRFGLAGPEFEDHYVTPLIKEFGSLAGAGIENLGLLSPIELRDLYSRASLGVVNMNWSEYTETFCCAATEMLSTSLPVFSVARGALPETIGRTGGAVLVKQKSLRTAATRIASLLDDPKRLAMLGRMGKQHVQTEYQWEHILDEWVRYLTATSSLESLTGRWRAPMSPQYLIEFVVGRFGLPWLIDAPVATLHGLRRRLS